MPERQGQTESYSCKCENCNLCGEQLILSIFLEMCQTLKKTQRSSVQSKKKLQFTAVRPFVAINPVFVRSENTC